MSISGELRGLYEPQREMREKRFDLEEKEVIDRIQAIMDMRRAEHLGSGRSADVIILDIWQTQETAPWVVKQENRRTREQEALNTTLENEFLIHDKAFAILERAKQQNPDKVYAEIPRPLQLLRDETNEWLLIELAPGETLFERTLRQHLLAYLPEDETERRDEVKRMRKDELIETVLTDEFRATLPPRVIDEFLAGNLEPDDRDYEQKWNSFCRMIALGVNKITKGPSTILSQQQYEALQNTINELHANGIHHRDLHSSNIQLAPDGRVFILDFGFAAEFNKQSLASGESGVYTIDVGHEFHEKKVILPVDLKMLESYWEIARKIK